MEFYEFDSFQDDEIPQPQPSLSLPITNIETLSKKIPNLNNFKSFLNFEEKEQEQKQHVSEKSDIVSDKYAKMSLSLFKDTEHDSDADLAVVGKETDEKGYNLTNKLSKVLNNNIINDSVVNELFNLQLNEDEIIDSNIMGSLSRKKLRSKVESNLISNQSTILKEYGPIVKQFQQVEKQLDHLNELNGLNTEKIAEIYGDMNHFNREFKKLNDDKSMVNLKKNLLINFKEKFLLNEFEEFVISNNEITADFLTILLKLDKINDNSSILLSIDDSNLGVNIMKKISKLIDKSNETLSHSIKRSLIHPVWVNSREKLIIFHYSVKVLKARNSDLLDSVLQEFIDDRSKSLIGDFDKQLNTLNAHDPVRFIGDLLAYVHAMVINEIELMNSIFKVTQKDVENENTSSLIKLDEEDVIQSKKVIDHLLDKILERLSKSIKTKFEQLVSIELKLKIIYSIFNLFDLYKLMFEKNFSGDNSLLKTILSLISFTQQRLLDLVGSRLKSIKSSNSAQLDLNSDLQPPEWILEFYSIILPLIDQSYSLSDNVFDLDGTRLADFLTVIVNEPIEILETHLSVNNFTVMENLIIKLNFLDVILSKILPLSLFNDKVLEVNDLIESLKQQLVELQYTEILTEFKLIDFQNIINMILPFDDTFFDVSIYQVITENKLFNKDQISLVNEALAANIPNTLIEIQNNFLKLNNPLVLGDIVEECCVRFLKFYLKFDLVVKEYLKVGLVWPDTEVAMVLGVEEAYAREKQGMDL